MSLCGCWCHDSSGACGIFGHAIVELSCQADERAESSNTVVQLPMPRRQLGQAFNRKQNLPF